MGHPKQQGRQPSLHPALLKEADLKGVLVALRLALLMTTPRVLEVVVGLPLALLTKTPLLGVVGMNLPEWGLALPRPNPTGATTSRSFLHLRQPAFLPFYWDGPGCPRCGRNSRMWCARGSPLRFCPTRAP